MASFKIVIEINPAKRTEFLQAFEMIESDESFINDRSEVSIFEQVRVTNTFIWTESWPSYERLEQYFESNVFRMMLGAINVLGTLVYKKVCRNEEEMENG